MKTTKEKAKELVYRHWVIPGNDPKFTISYHQAVKCAKITAQEIITQNWGNNTVLDYWQSVIEEIINLENAN